MFVFAPSYRLGLLKQGIRVFVSTFCPKLQRISGIINTGLSRKGKGTATAASQTNSFENFRTSFANNYPKNVTNGVQNNSARSARGIVLYPSFHSSDAVSDCDG